MIHDIDRHNRAVTAMVATKYFVIPTYHVASKEKDQETYGTPDLAWAILSSYGIFEFLWDAQEFAAKTNDTYHAFMFLIFRYDSDSDSLVQLFE